VSPKRPELVQDGTSLPDGTVKDDAFFEQGMTRAFAQGRRALRENGVGSVVFAHKTTEGWEALLSGMIGGGWTITGSWPIATEMGGRLRARDSAALATSVHLVCRPRGRDAPVGEWGNVIRELPGRVAEWMTRLQAEGIRGADLVFACIGPALEIYSRYSKVETAEGEEVMLNAYLQKVWEVVGRVALTQILNTDTPNQFGEDVRLTALFLWTLRATGGSSDGPDGGADSETVMEDDEDAPDDEEAAGSRKRQGGYSLPYDIVRRFCQPLGIHLERWNGNLIEIKKGIVTLLPIDTRADRLLGGEVAKDIKLVKDKPEPKVKQRTLFDSLEPQENEQETARRAAARQRYDQATWSHLHQDTIPLLDHVHKAMLFQKQGQTNALRELLKFELAYRPEFLRLANALSALYPQGSEEKRLLDAMLLAVPR
jgi:putative DNA methylase